MVGAGELNCSKFDEPKSETESKKEAEEMKANKHYHDNEKVRRPARGRPLVGQP